jgi:tetratricopeptide (TPR) repeat protein
MKDKNKLSVPVIVLSGLLLAGLSLLVFLLLQFIINRFSPSYSNAERLLRSGKLDEAFVITEGIKTESAEKMLLRGKIFLAKSLQQQKKSGWRHYGNDTHDWLQGPEVDSALACFNKARFLKGGDHALAMYYLGVVYKEKGWFQDAEDALQESLRLDPDNINARLALSSLFSQIDNLPKAMQLLDEAYQLAPNNPQVAKNTAFLYRFHLEIPESSIVWLNRYLDLAEPGDIDINEAKIEIQELLARYPEYAPKETPAWKKKQRQFKPRHNATK